MDSILIIAVVVVTVAILAMLLKIFSMFQQGSQKDRQLLLESLQRNSKDLNERLDNAAKVIGDVQKNIGEMSEIGRSMKELQDFLKSPKVRGNMGEHILNELLGQMFPKSSFYLQYTFKSGEKVDAAIKTEAGMIPIDSKFPMENFRRMVTAKSDEEMAIYRKDFNRDVRKHIDDISRKYILMDEGTIDYALMYIPSEAVYYEIVNEPSLFDFSAGKRVLPVSPTTFYAYMRAILVSFESSKIETGAREILAILKSVQSDYVKVEAGLKTLGRHIVNANNSMSSLYSDFGKLGQKIERTQVLKEKTTVKEDQLISQKTH